MNSNREEEAATDISLSRESIAYEASAERFRGRIRCAVPSRGCDQVVNRGWSSAALGCPTCAPPNQGPRKEKGEVYQWSDLGTVIDAIRVASSGEGKQRIK